MLNIMRKNASSWLIKIIFSIIVIVFIFWGVGSFRESNADRVALVNDDAISVESYQSEYDYMVDQLKQQYGDQLNRDIIKMFQVPRQVIDKLINRQLLLQEAEKLKIRVSDRELKETIRDMDVFQEGGAFNKRRYDYILERNRLKPEDFEASQRQSMVIEKLTTFITSGVKVPDGEIAEMYDWQSASVDIDYVLFAPADIKDVAPTEDDLQSYYETNKENYKTEPKVKVRYLEFRSDRFADDVTIPDEDVQEYYDTHQSEFTKEKTVEARHILIKVDENAAPEVVEEKRKKAEEIANKAREGKDFAELAKEFSEGPTREKGGLLGEFKKGDMVAPFSDAAFSMAAGEISDPVRTQFGWHVIKVEKVNEASTSPLEAATGEIRKKLTKETSKSIAYDKADAAYDMVLKDEDIEKTAAELNMELQSTDYFTENGPETGISDPVSFARTAFDLSDSDISDILNIGDNYYILQKTDTIPSSIPDLADVKDKVRPDLIKKIQDERAGKKAEAFLEEIKEKDDMESAAKDADLEIHNSGFFQRNGPIPDIGPETEIIQAAFSISDNKKYPDTVFKSKKGYCVIQFKARKTPDPAELDDNKKETLKKQLLSQKQQNLFSQWISNVRAASVIHIEEGYID